MQSEELEHHFWEHTSAGLFVLAIGSMLLFVLKRSSPQKPPVSFVELSILALGFGVLIGTLLISWHAVDHRFTHQFR